MDRTSNNINRVELQYNTIVCRIENKTDILQTIETRQLQTRII